MILSAIISIPLLVGASSELLVQRVATPREIASFNGVSISIDQDALNALPSTGTVRIPDFPLGTDRNVNLQLQRFDVLTPEAELVVASVNGDGVTLQRPLEEPNVVFLRGVIEGDPSSRVFIALGEHASNGLIESDGRTYVLANERMHGLATVFNLTDVDPDDMNWIEFYCSVQDAAKPVVKKTRERARSVGSGCQALQVAIDTDWEFTGSLFSGNTSASAEYALTLMAAVSSIYQSDMDVAIQVCFLRVWNDSSDPWSASNTGEQLPEFKEHWDDKMGDVPRHLAHLFSGRNLGGGRAWVSAVCTGIGYAVSANLDGSFPMPTEDNNPNNWDLVVVAHETGHNCGTWHTHDYSPPIDECAFGGPGCDNAFGGTIMSYCHQCSGGMSNIVLSFHPEVQETIMDYLANDISCSLDCDQFLQGACCFEPDGCEDVLAVECFDLGGLFLGSGTFCITGICEPQEPGACCVEALDMCFWIDKDACDGANGTFLGEGTTCNLGWCDSDFEFACCTGGICNEMSSYDCAVLGGCFLGIGAFCGEGDCPTVDNDTCETAMSIGTGSWAFSTCGATSSEDIPDQLGCNDSYLGYVSSDVWFIYQACFFGDDPTVTSELLVSTCGVVDFNTDLVIYEGTCEDMNTDQDWLDATVGCNGDTKVCPAYSSEVAITVTQGKTYLIRVGGNYFDEMGSGQLVIGGEHDCLPDVPCLGDVTLDNEVDISDVLAIIEHWGETLLQYDVNEDGIVNSSDILIILGNWGHCEI